MATKPQCLCIHLFKSVHLDTLIVLAFWITFKKSSGFVSLTMLALISSTLTITHQFQMRLQQPWPNPYLGASTCIPVKQYLYIVNHQDKGLVEQNKIVFKCKCDKCTEKFKGVKLWDLRLFAKVIAR